MRLFKLLVVGLLFIGFGATADGLPRPWPFPWAVDCQMDWVGLNGRYQMSDSSSRDQILVRINDDASKWKVVRIVRMTARGNIRAIGLALVPEEDREVRVQMVPIRKGDAPNWMTLRMHYQQDGISSCDAKDLVPILIVSKKEDPTVGNALNYLLVKLPEDTKN